MLKYVLKRILYIIVVFFILSLLMYVIYDLIPGNPAATAARELIKNNKQYADRYDEFYLYYQRLYGIDGNLFQRYLRWMGLYPYTNPNTGAFASFNGLLQGNLGNSTQYNKPVVDVISTPLKTTVFINIFATVAGLGITIPLGIFCAVKKGSKRDVGVQVGTIIGYSMPTFIVAILFIWFFAILLPIFPVSGMETTGAGYTGIRLFFDKVYHFTLPLAVMTFCSLGGMTRYVRASMIDALSLDCIKTARAKGLMEKTVIYVHAWRNALVPVVILVVGWFLGIFSGSVMIENIFGINGIGKTYFSALNAGDNEVILALQMFYVFIGLAGNLIIDLVYGLVDPRIRVNK